MALWDEVLVGYRTLHGRDDPKTLTALAQYATSLLDLDRNSDAEPVLRNLLEARERVQPDKWSTFNTRSGLGGVLVTQGRFADAEPLLVSGYEGMVARREQHMAATRIRIGEALERLEQLYSAWGRGDAAEVWRAKREAFAASED